MRSFSSICASGVLLCSPAAVFMSGNCEGERGWIRGDEARREQLLAPTLKCRRPLPACLPPAKHPCAPRRPLTSSLTERSPAGKCGFSAPLVSSYLASAFSRVPEGPLR